MLSEHFPESTGLRYIGELYHALGNGLKVQDQRGQPDTEDGVESYARARAFRDVLNRTIQRSWYCINKVQDKDRPRSPEDLAHLYSPMIDTPERMMRGGLHTLLAINASVKQDIFREMALRYYRSAEQRQLLPRPDNEEQVPLLYPATKAMEFLTELRKGAQAFQNAPQNHPEFAAQLAGNVLKILAAVYAVQHYLASSSSGETQIDGIRLLDRELALIQSVSKDVKAGPATNRTLASVLGDLRVTIPLQETEPRLYMRVAQEILHKEEPILRPAPSTEPVTRTAPTAPKAEPATTPVTQPSRKPRGP